MPLRDLLPWRRNDREVTEAALTPAQVPEREGYATGIPPGGITEYTGQMGAATQTDRRTLMQQLYEAYLACPWSWASVNAVSRTITAGGLVTDWDADDGEGDQETPDKPAEVLALERLIRWCNPQQDIRQLTRNVIADLLVFGDAFIEVTWVGNVPVAMYNLDCPSVSPLADEHGVITGYVQTTEFGQRAEFDPREVIHIQLDSPRSGIFGVSPTQAALLPITAWLFAASTGKEIMRKGMPPTIHVDFPAGTSVTDMNRWMAQYAQRNLGPRNIGVPIGTKGGAPIKELQTEKVSAVESFLNQKRDEILACYGVPPAKAGVIESGNLGGGTGESQDRTFRVNTCQPIAELVLEKINFAIVQQGFGVTGWSLKFNDVDMRDSKTVEEIRDMRLRNGSYTLNKYRTEIGEPPVDGGDAAVLVDRENLVLWADMAGMSKAVVAAKLKGTELDPAHGDVNKPMELEKPEPKPVPAALQPFAGAAGDAGGGPPTGPPGPPGPPGAQDEQDDKTTAESLHAAYRRRLTEALSAFGTVPALEPSTLEEHPLRADDVPALLPKRIG